MAGASKRDQLIDTALTLFYRDGFTATGIDKILSEAGVAKMTLYKHFRSKEELICAVLHRRDENFRNWLFRRMEDMSDTPGGQLLAMYDALREWFVADGFRGCMFIKASAVIGWWSVIGLTILTAVLGTALIRVQGFQALHNLRGSMADGKAPVEPVVDGVFLLIAAPLMMTPGFLTDTIGFLLLVPPVRHEIARYALRRLRRAVDNGNIRVVRH